MSNSSLVNYVKISPFRTSPRQNRIKKITIHHMAGNLSVESCGNVFQRREASSNYGIDSKGRVGMYVEEKDRSWCSSSGSNDHQAVTIEVADDVIGNGWHSSDAAMIKLIELCVDICRRNGISRLNYTGNTSGNLTMHKWFVSTDCPGAYLERKFPWIASEVNKRLAGGAGNIVVPDSENINVDPMNKGYLCKGDVGESVRTMQKMLIAVGFSCGSCGADASFGNDTVSALKAFQRANGLSVDGSYGPISQGALKAKYNALGASGVSSNSSSGALSVDGYWGKKTTIKLQQIFGTTVDGIISNQWAMYRTKNPGLESSTFNWCKTPNGQGSELIRAIQKWAGMPSNEQDGEIGDKTIRAIQKKLGTVQDGYVSGPSNMVKKLQNWANNQR